MTLNPYQNDYDFLANIIRGSIYHFWKCMMIN